MPTTRSFFTACLLAAAAAACPLACENADDANDADRANGADDVRVGEATIASIHESLEGLRQKGVTGLAAEFDIGRASYEARSGVARLGTSEPIPDGARFRMGSVTKTFVAVVALQLVGEGKLSLEDSVETLLPGVVKGAGYDGSKITLRQLLQHTSGIFNYTSALLEGLTADSFEQLRSNPPTDVAALVALALARPPDFAPGAGWNYSNTNYLLAGLIIERATGQNWRVEVRERILEPLGLDETDDPGPSPDIEGPHANAYEQFAEGGPLVDVTRTSHGFADAAGSLLTTTRDLSAFFRALQQGRLLRPAEMAEMHRTVPASSLAAVVPGVEYGLGIMRLPGTCGAPYWSHFGDAFGYATRDAVSDDGTRAVVLSLTTNVAGAAALDVIHASVGVLDDAMCKFR
jgi:D-alanyl-D-alanine carboxypeptidase